MKLRTLLVLCFVSAFALTASLSTAQRGRGSFGGGGHSFGGGGGFGGGHSFGGGGGSFGGSRPSGGGSFGSHSSFGGGGGSFGRSSSGSSFSRSGGFGRSGSVSSSSMYRPSYSYSRPLFTRPYYGSRYNAYYYGGWSDYSFYWGRPSWWYYTPFHPAFYWGAPVMYGN